MAVRCRLGEKHGYILFCAILFGVAVVSCDKHNEEETNLPQQSVVASIAVSTSQYSFVPNATISFAVVLRDAENQPVEGIVVGVYDNMRMICAQTTASDVSGQTHYNSQAPSAEGAYTLSFFVLNGPNRQYAVLVDNQQPPVHTDSIWTANVPSGDRPLGTQSSSSIDQLVGYAQNTVVETVTSPAVIFTGLLCGGALLGGAGITIASGGVGSPVAAGVATVACGTFISTTQTTLAFNTAKNTAKLSIDQMPQLSPAQKEQYKNNVDQVAAGYGLLLTSVSVAQAPQSGTSVLNYKVSTNRGSFANQYAQEFVSNLGDLWDSQNEISEVNWGSVHIEDSSIVISYAFQSDDPAPIDTLESYKIVSIGFALSSQPQQDIPEVDITSPQEGAAVSGIQTLSCTASDSDGIARVTFRVGQAVVAVDSVQPYSVQWDTRSSSNGSYQIFADATDSTGLIGSDSITVFVNNPSVTWNRILMGTGSYHNYGLCLSRTLGYPSVVVSNWWAILFVFRYVAGQWTFVQHGLPDGYNIPSRIVSGDVAGTGGEWLYIGYSGVGVFGGQLWAGAPDGDGFSFTALTPGGWGATSFWRPAVGNGRGDGVMRAYVIGSGDVKEISYSNGWQEPAHVGTVSTGLTGLVVGDGRSDGSIHVYACGNNGHLFEFTWLDGWYVADVASVGGDLTDLAMGTGRNDGVNRLYASGDIWGEGIFEFSWNGTAWSGQRIDDGSHEFKSIAVGDGRNDGMMRIYCGAANDSLYEASFGSGIWQVRSIGSTFGDVYDLEIGDGRGDGVNRVYAATEGANTLEFSTTP